MQSISRPRADQHFQRMLRAQAASALEVLGHLGRREQLEVAVLQALEVLAGQVPVNVGGQGAQVGESGFHGRTKENLPAGR